MPFPRCTLLNLLVSVFLATLCIFKSDVYPQNPGGAVILGHPSISLSVCQLLSWWEEGGCGCWPRAQTWAEPLALLPLGLMQRHSCKRHLASDVAGEEELLLVRAPFEFLLWKLQANYVINTSDIRSLLSVYFSTTWEGWVKQTGLKLRSQVKQYYYVLHHMFQNHLLNLLLKFKSYSDLIHKKLWFQSWRLRAHLVLPFCLPFPLHLELHKKLNITINNW